MKAHRVLVALGALMGLGCPATDPCTEEPAYGGLGNDEVWLTLQEAKAEAAREGDFPTVIAPESGQVVGGAAPTFTWESPLKLALTPPRGAPLFRASPSLLDQAIDAAARALVPVAHAHLPPVSSDAYLLDVLVPGRECPVSVVTTELSHTLDEGTWATLREAAGKDLTLQLTSAYLASGRIQEGPFKAEDVTFQVE